VDQGEKRDTFALAMGHVEEITIKALNDKGLEEEHFRLKVIIVIVEGWVPDKENRISVSFANVEEVIKNLASHFHVSTVTYDQWSSAEAIQRLFSDGIYTKQLGANLEMYDVLKQLIYQGQVILPNHTHLVKELKQLTLIKGRKVDHPNTSEGCFTGDTEVKLLNGTSVTLKELADKGRDHNFWVYSALEDGTVVPAKAYNAHKTKEVEELAIVTLDNGEQLRCTVDHLYMLKNGSYKQAKDLVVNDSLMPLTDRILNYNHTVKKIEIVKLEKPIEVYDITVPRYNNFALKAGIFVHNSKDYADAVCRVVWLCYCDYILDTIHGKHILPLKQQLPTLRSVASAYEVLEGSEINPQGIIWENKNSGAGIFGETVIVRQNIIPNIKSK
jgi:intein/homing endonuclease